MMLNSKPSVPVLFLTFNRLDTAKLVFEQIRKAQVPRLYIASDGPRSNIDREKDMVNSVREYVLSNIDWKCEVFTLFRAENLGCKVSVSQSIDWFFANEEMGIILEDDCLPSQSFFTFCECLLNLYKDDERIFLISGFNHQNQWKENNCDYFFSLLGGIWGWASWRRAWAHYDVNLDGIDEFIANDGFVKALGSSLGKIKQDMIYNGIIKNQVNSWALQWGYARHKNNALTCIPSRSLIENIGFGTSATHTKEVDFRQVKNHEIDFPLNKNISVISDEDYDVLMFPQTSLFSRFLRRVKNFILNH